MGKRTAIAFVLVALVFACGYLVYDRMLGPRATSGASADAGLSRITLDAQPSPPPLARRGVVTAIAGKVDWHGGDGAWRSLVVGEELTLDAVVRTGEDGTAMLSLGETASVTVAEGTELTVAELSTTLSRVRLGDGRISARVRGEESGRLQVEVTGSDVVAESARGDFSVLSDGAGQVAVAANEGTVALSARGESVTVGAGEQSSVVKDRAPSAPQAIPPSLFLKLRGVGDEPQRTTETTIRGTTTPGAVVSINGVRAPVGEDGAFVAMVPVREGRNQVRVEVVDVSGRRQEKSVPVTVDTRPPDVSGTVDWN